MNITFFKQKLAHITATSLLAVLIVSWAPLSAFAAGGYSWASVSGLGPAFCYAMQASQDGKYVICAAYGQDLYTSSDYGATWAPQPNSGVRDWYGAAISSTGQYMVGVVDGGDIYRSSDYGAHWADQASAGSQSWGNATISSDGQTITATHDSSVSVSRNGGVSWTDTTPAVGVLPYPLAASPSGKNIVVSGGIASYLYYSTDYGATWNTASSAGSHNWSTLSSSSTGQYFTASDSGAPAVNVSSDYGATWVQKVVPGAGAISGSMISSDGQTLIAESNSNSLYESYDGGNTWTADTNLPSGGWYALAASGDLSRVVAFISTGNAYYGSDPALYVPPPVTTPTTTPTANSSVAPDPRQLTNTGLNVAFTVTIGTCLLLLAVTVKLHKPHASKISR